MPWPLILSILPLIALMGWLIIHEKRSDKKHDEMHEENRESIKPVAELADDLHKKRFGRGSTELGEVFPELKAIK